MINPVSTLLKDYLTFLDVNVWNNSAYRSAIIMHTFVTVMLSTFITVSYLKTADYIWPPEGHNVTHIVTNNPGICDISELQDNYTKLLKEVENLRNSSGELNTTLLSHAVIIESTTANITSMDETVQMERHSQLERHFKNVRNVDDALLTLKYVEVWQFACVLLILVDIVIVVLFVRLKSWVTERLQMLNSGQLQIPVTSEFENGGRPSSILDEVDSRSTENCVCILSFNGDPAHKKHMTLSQTFIGSKVKVTDFVVHREEDILDIPLSKVVLVHVDYNARNIILENPDREVGEMKRMTVLALWRMSAEVILLYHYEERNSKPLGDKDLYNSELLSVKTQTELKKLESQRRFVSVNGQLSASQKQHLNGLITKALG